MPNAYANKVQVTRGGQTETLIDLTADTITASALMQGYTAHDASGAPITGTATGGSMVIRDEADSHGGTIRHITAGTVVTGTTSITQNGTYDVAQYADAVVSVPDSTFVVNVSWNSSTDRWEPDCTWAEVNAAAQAGKEIVAVGPMDEMVAADCEWNSSDGSLYYIVYWTDSAKWQAYVYELAQDGIFQAWDNTIRYPSGTINITASGNTNVAQYATAYVPSGTAGTPTATKGTVSNHAVSVTPSVTNTAGYISGGTKTGTAVSVSASELVSGTLSITSSGTKDVTNYASASVAAGSATASATKGTVSNHSVTVTPTATRTAGYVTAGSSNGTAVTVTASELASGNKEITENGSGIDVVGYSTVSVAVPSSGGNTITVFGNGNSTGCYVQLNNTGTKYYTDGDEIPFSDGDELYIFCSGKRGGATITVDGVSVAHTDSGGTSYTLSLLNSDVSVGLSYSNDSDVAVAYPAISITQNGKHDVSDYAYANVSVGGSTELKLGAIRPDAELVKKWTYDKLLVEDEDVTIPAYTTSQASLFSGANFAETVQLDLSTYDYYMTHRLVARIMYSSQSVGAGRLEYALQTGGVEIVMYPAGTYFYGGPSTSAISTVQITGTAYRLVYYNSSSSIDTQSPSTRYGVYTADTQFASVLSGYSTINPTLTARRPPLSIRGHSTYFSSTYWALIEDIRFQFVSELWRAPKTANIDGYAVKSQLDHIIACMNTQSETLT